MLVSTQSNPIVLDCCVTMAWCFEDESTIYTEKILSYLDEHTAIVPALWSLEVTNVLVLALQKKRITKSQATHFKNNLQLLPIEIDYACGQLAMNTIFDIATEFKLTAYDATYLELAQRKGIPISTMDKALVIAAKSLKIEIF